MSPLSLPRWLLIAGLGALLLRGWLALTLPITGDEAYFIWWGWLPDWGFYDHPPMIGWWLAALSLVSKAEWWLRLPSKAFRWRAALAAGRLRHRVPHGFVRPCTGKGWPRVRPSGFQCG